MRIPEDVIEKIRDETAIEEVVRHFLPLQPSGRTFKAKCPFHNEKTPSFHVIPEKGIFYCFGCQKGGDVFRFLMDKEGMLFPEALEWCASRMGLDLSRFAQEDGEGGESRAGLYRATEWAQEWFSKQLAAPVGAKAREYARGRGLRSETIESFGLGFAPDDGSQLQRAANEAQLSTEQLLQVALLGRKEGRAPFAYFRSRLIFPVRGVAKKIYGFGGRILGPGEPKYLNSPETSIFHKRKVLYALSQARANVVRSRSALLVEGYLDALLLHQAGWTNTVATCGTALTPDQASLLRRYAETVILIFDGDAAGLKAAFKAADAALAVGLDVRIVRLPEGRDPADLLKDGEVQSMQDAIESATGLVGCLAAEVAKRGNRREHKERALHHLKNSLASISDPIRAELLSQEAAEVFGVPEKLLRITDSPVAKTTTPPKSAMPHSEEGIWTRIEMSLLRHAMASRAARHHLFESLGPEDLRDEALQEIFVALHSMDARLPEQADAALLAQVPEHAQALTSRLLAEMPSEELDALAELTAVLERRAQLLQQEQAQGKRQELEQAYSTGEDWRRVLEPHDDSGTPHSGSNP